MVKNRLTVLVLVCVSLLAGCSKTTGENTKDKEADVILPPITDKPLNLKVYQSNANISDLEFKQMIADPVNKKYPNITVEIVRPDPKISKQELVSSGEFPDLIYTNTAGLQQYIAMNLPLDLNPFIKKYKYDLSRFKSNYIDDMKVNAYKGELFGLPFSVNFDVLYYNKDIFDKFAVSYPKDGMTWDDVIELAKRVSRTENGIKYEGLHPTFIHFFASQMSLPIIDRNTEKPLVNTDGWKKAFELYKRISDVTEGGIDPNGTRGRFNTERRLAMMAHYGARVGEFEELYQKGTPLNWDMVTYPTFKEKPGISQGADTHYLMVSSTGKHIEDAFQLVTFLLNDENQVQNARLGRLSATKNPEVKKQFGADVKTLQGKNIEAIFKSTPAPLAPPTKYDEFAVPLLKTASIDFIKGGGDVNTALLKLEDQLNKEIEAHRK